MDLMSPGAPDSWRIPDKDSSCCS